MKEKKAKKAKTNFQLEQVVSGSQSCDEEDDEEKNVQLFSFKLSIFLLSSLK